MSVLGHSSSRNAEILSKLANVEKNVLEALEANNKSAKDKINIVSFDNSTHLALVELLKTQVEQHQQKMNEVDELRRENQTLQMQIITMENELGRIKQQENAAGIVNNNDQFLQNRIDILERYVKNDAQFEGRRAQEHQEVLILSNKIDDLNDRITIFEEQCLESIQDLQSRRTNELESFKKNINILKRYSDDLRCAHTDFKTITQSDIKEIKCELETVQKDIAFITKAAGISHAIAQDNQDIQDTQDILDTQDTQDIQDGQDDIDFRAENQNKFYVIIEEEETSS
ncbi:hypothetical protein [Parasitella parasitica]|uniref:Uncharacterized protein n=1 Tax=Parasitella parasitica TaxID=35722 RepID=A0A0B7N455_9FUNG|nr:hypothetical protein [Parasitella parasitica]